MERLDQNPYANKNIQSVGTFLFEDVSFMFQSLL